MENYILLITRISNCASFVVNYHVGDKFDGCWSVVGFVMSLFNFLRVLLMKDIGSD
jgi:hypothetical protein